MMLREHDAALRPADPRPEARDSTSAGAITVLQIPFDRVNPYQRLLAEALRETGVVINATARNRYLLPILSAWCAAGYPEIVHLHWTQRFVLGPNRVLSLIRTLQFLFEIWVLHWARRRIVWTVHDLVDLDGRMVPWHIRWNRWLAHRADGIIVHGEPAMRRVRATYRLEDETAAKIEVIPHGNYLGAYRNDIDRAAARERLALEPAGTVFLFFGQMKRYKGIELLLEAFRALDDAKARLVLAGRPVDGSVLREVEQAAGADARIRYDARQIDDDDIQVYMNAADAVVLPFTESLTSGSVLLAMSFGRAVVVPAIGAIEELVDTDGAILFEPGEVAALADALGRTRTLDLEAMGRHNLARMRDHDWRLVAARTAALYDKVRGRGRA